MASASHQTMSDTTTRDGNTVTRTVTTRTESEHVAVVTLERKDDLAAGAALTTTAGSANVGSSHGAGSASSQHISGSNTSITASSGTVPTLLSSSTTTGGASKSRDTSLHRETHHSSTATTTGGGGSTYVPTAITGTVHATGAGAAAVTTASSATSTTATTTTATSGNTTGGLGTVQTAGVSLRPQIAEQESYTMVKTKTKAAPKQQTTSSSKFITSTGGNTTGGTATGGYEYQQHTEQQHGERYVPQVHHEHYQHHAQSGTTTTSGSTNIERKVPMTTTHGGVGGGTYESSGKHESTFAQYAQKPAATTRTTTTSEKYSEKSQHKSGGGGGNDTDTDNEEDKQRTATSSRTGYHSAHEQQQYSSHKHHKMHFNYDNEYHDRKKREHRLRVVRSRSRRRAALRRWCRCDSVCFLLILGVLHMAVASTIIGLNIAAWIVSGMWLIKVIDFLFWVFALGFLSFLLGVVCVVVTYKLRSPYGIGGGGVNRSRTINTLRGGTLDNYGGKEEERLVGMSHHHGLGTSSAIANDHVAAADLLSGNNNDLEETETSYGDVPAQRRKHRIHYALLFLLCLIVIALSIVAYLLITYDYHEPMDQQIRDGSRGTDYSVFNSNEQARRPQEATFSRYYTQLYNKVNNLSDEEKIDSAHTLNKLRSLLITFVALELGLAIITLGLAFVYLFRGYRLRCPCLVPDSQSCAEGGIGNGGGGQPIVSPSQMTLSRVGGGGGGGGALTSYAAQTGGHVVREFDREERETVRLVA